MVTPGTEIELLVDSLAHGGEGVGRCDGQVVFLPGGLPGDRWTVEITRAQSRLLRARGLALLEPSPLRRQPPCSIADRCGGCPWMALTDTAQLDFRTRLVADQLARVARMPDVPLRPILAAPQPLGYRNRLRLHAEGLELGFRALHSRGVVDVPSCAVADPRLNQLLRAARQHLAPFLPLLEPLQLELYVDADDALFMAVSGSNAAVFKGFQPQPLTVRCLIDARPLETRGIPRLPFAQANHAQNAVMIEQVGAALNPQPTDRLLDLFAGAGNLSLPLASRVARIVGVETSPEAVEQARRTAPSHARYRQEDALKAVHSLIQQRDQFELVILDPPRGGALEVVKLLPRLNPRRIAYVSCDPATLARDLKALAEDGYRVEWVQPIDLMPQTAHVESLALLARAR
jgi:23S rRNA (uracil1939-C5)-methyltransferase